MTKSNRIWIYSFVVMGILIVIESGCAKKTDDSGNTTVYESVTIGTQVWMLKNLNVTKYRNGDAIPNVTDNAQLLNLTSGAYCNYDNSNTNADTYGRLYNGYAVKDSRNIAPTGWHVATDAEWNILTTYLGGESVAGGKLKEAGTAHWLSPNNGATNESGFTALPGGFRYESQFFYIREMGYWWTSSEVNLFPDELICWDIYTSASFVSHGGSAKKIFQSVRCVKD